MSRNERASLQMRKPNFATNINIGSKSKSRVSSSLPAKGHEKKPVIDKKYILSPLSTMSPQTMPMEQPKKSPATIKNNFTEDKYFKNSQSSVSDIISSPLCGDSRTKNSLTLINKDPSLQYLQAYDQSSLKDLQESSKKQSLGEHTHEFHQSRRFRSSDIILSMKETEYTAQQKGKNRSSLGREDELLQQQSSSNSTLSRLSIAEIKQQIPTLIYKMGDIQMDSITEDIMEEWKEEGVSNSIQIEQLSPSSINNTRKPTIVLHSAVRIPEEQQASRNSIRSIQEKVGSHTKVSSPLLKTIHEELDPNQVRKKSTTYSHVSNLMLNQLIKDHEKKEIDQINSKALLFPESNTNIESLPQNEVYRINDQEFTIRNKNKTSFAVNENLFLNQNLQYLDKYGQSQKITEESCQGSINQIISEARIQRNKTISKTEQMNRALKKSKFKGNSLPERSLRILIYKKREQRNNEDINTLQKATAEMNFFQELLSKKSNIQNNIHQSLCKAMQFEFCKKGSIVFYTGDIPDRFYILLKGEVAVMLKKQQEEVDSLKKGSNVDPTDEKKKSKFTLRKYLLLKKFQNAIKNLRLILDFIRRIKTGQDVLSDSQSPKNIKDFFSFNSSQVMDSKHRFSSSLSPTKKQSPLKQELLQKRTSKIIQNQFQSQRTSLLSPEYPNNSNQSNDTSCISPASPTLSNENRSKKKKRDKMKREQVLLKSQTQGSAQKSIELFKKSLLPSQLVIFERKQQEQLKQNIDSTAKSVTGLFRMPKLSTLHQSIKKSDTASTPVHSQQSHADTPKSNKLTPNTLAPQQSQKSGDHSPSQQEATPQRRSVRTSFLKKKIKVDFQKVRLGVRLAKLFEPSSTTPQLNLGGAKIQALYQSSNEQFKKILPKLDLMTLENSAHFFDENVFKYFHATNLNEGQVFGDLGILTKKPRAATIVCNEDCYFGVLNVEDYSKILMDQKKKKMQKGIKFLASTIGINLSIEKMAKISQFFEKRCFNAGERIYDEGERVSFIYVVKKGEIELFRKMQTSYGIKQTQTIQISIGIIGAKAYFGEDDALLNRRRKYTAIAKINSKLLVCKKKDFLKLMNEISEMSLALKTMIGQKEYWRDQKYLEIQSMRNSIKLIDNIDKIHHKSNSVSSPNQTDLDAAQTKYIQELFKDIQTTQHTNQTQKTLTNYTQENEPEKPVLSSEELVRMQLFQLEKKQQLTNQAISRLKESQENSPSLSFHKSSPTNSFYHSSPRNQSPSQHQYLQNVSHQQYNDQSFSNLIKTATPHSQDQNISPKAKEINNQQSPWSPKSPRNQDTFSAYLSDHLVQESKEQEMEPLTSIIAKDDFIGSGINSQKCYFKGNYDKMSPRLKEIITQNPDLIKEGQLKELLCKIQKKKQILHKNQLGKQQLSALNVFRITRDICMGGNVSLKKQEAVAERRKSLKSVDGYNVKQKKEKDDIVQGKITSQKQVELLIQSLKEKQKNKGDISEVSLNAEFLIKSQYPLSKPQSNSIYKRNNSLSTLLNSNSEAVNRKDSVIENSSLNNSWNFNGIMLSTNSSNFFSASQHQKKPEIENFIYYGQQNAANALKSKSSFFYNPKHTRIGSFNSYAKNIQLSQKPSQIQQFNSSGIFTSKENNTSLKSIQKQSQSQTYGSGFFKPITEFISSIPSPHNSTASQNKSSQNLISNPIQKQEKIVIVNHMGKPITFTQSLRPESQKQNNKII